MARIRGSAAQALITALPTGPNGYFGTLTRAALTEFQASVGIKPALGNFGSVTRNYLKVNY